MITAILIEDIENKRFSIANFYERRARRILPVLFFIMLACIPFAWMWMLPFQMKDFSQSLVAISLFASNILFWRESGYFAAAAEEKPMLHTWSLAVEEQYYMLFPIFLLITWRFGKNRLFSIIVVLASISLLLSEWGWRNEATANFYLAPTRAWELFAGSLSAFAVHRYGVQKNNFLSLFGLVAIIFAIFFYDETTPTPSVYSLVPVLGAVLLILFSNKETLTSKLVSNKGFVGIGLISYSAYLWHQPLFAFARIRSLEQQSPLLFLLLSICSLILSYFTWRFIEIPFRKKNNLSQFQIFILSFFLLAYFSIFGVLGHLKNGFPYRIDNSLRASIEQLDEKSLRLAGIGCHLEPGDSILFPSDCGVNLEENQIDLLLIGDSHLDAIGLQILQKLDALGVSAYALSYSGCVPISGLNTAGVDNGFQCVEYNQEVREFARTNNVRTIALIGRFPLYLLGERYDNGEGGVEPGNPVSVYLDKSASTAEPNDNDTRIEAILSHYRFDIETLLKEFNVVVFAPTPEVGWNVPIYYSKRMMFPSHQNQSEISISHNYEGYLERSRLFMNMLNSITSEHLYIYDISKIFCSNETGRCAANIDEKLLYRDDNHLSHFAASIVSGDFVQFYNDIFKTAINE